MKSHKYYLYNLALITLVFFFSLKLIVKLRNFEFRQIINEIEKKQKVLPYMNKIEPRDIVRNLRKVNKLFGVRSCLQNSISSFLILKKFGRNPKLLIGVKKTEEEIESHSWIEENGIAILEPESVKKDFSIILEKN